MDCAMRGAARVLAWSRHAAKGGKALCRFTRMHPAVTKRKVYRRLAQVRSSHAPCLDCHTSNVRC